MRTLLVIVVVALTAATAWGQGYIEKKDNDALAVIERVMVKVKEEPRLFDGRRVPAAADLQEVRAFVDLFDIQMRSAESAMRELSPAGQQRGGEVLRRYERWAAYGRALKEGYREAQVAADDKARRDAAVAARDKEQGIATCKAFNAEVLADHENATRLSVAVRIAGGSGEYLQTVEAVAAMQAALKIAGAACAKPEYAGIARACEYGRHGTRVDEADWCATARNADAVVKQSARNLAAFHAEHLLVGRKADELERYEGWLEVEGSVTWKAYFSGAHAKDLIAKRLGPLFAQAGLGSAGDAEVFQKLDAHFTALEAKVRDLASSWDLPGTPCKGVGCGAAKSGVMSWNGGAKLRRLTQDDAGWKISQNELGIPTHRWKSGYALIEVKGDPMCQLRSWTVTENHKGGGRYETARTAAIGYVRWQTCR